MTEIPVGVVTALIRAVAEAMTNTKAQADALEASLTARVLELAETSIAAERVKQKAADDEAARQNPPLRNPRGSK